MEEDKLKIISKYKKRNLEIKTNRGINLEREIKSYDMSSLEKIRILNSIESISSFKGIAKIFNKKDMDRHIINCNIFYNYAVKILIKDLIIPYINHKKIEFIISLDNRNVGVGNLKNLENYLNTEFCLYNYKFKVTYYNSCHNYGIQLADLIVNTFYNKYKDYNLIENVIKGINNNKFIVSLFPYKNDKIIC